MEYRNMQFSKMHGLGNDFVVVNAVTQDITLSSKMIHSLSDRHRGIGFDQLLIVEPPYNPEFDFHYRIFNADGSETYQCGNGARCIAHFVRMKNLTKKCNIHVSTKTRRMILTITNDNLVRVNMGEPNFGPNQITLFNKKEAKKNYIINISKQIILFNVVSIGNPHCIINVDNIENVPISIIGPILANHEFFPQKANIGFMQILSSKHIKLRVYERGTGETQACGSGACAAAAVGILHGYLTEHVQVELIGGKLFISWKGPGHPLYMTGSSNHIYDGYIDI